MNQTKTLHPSLKLCCLAIVLTASASRAQTQQGADPALANMAGAEAAQPQDQQSYPQQAPAPIERSAPSATAEPDSYNAPQPSDALAAQPGQPSTDSQAVDAEAAGASAINDADLSADQPPPPLPEYDQPPAPADNYLWTPGYWGYGPVGYYWVPGVWIVPPYYGTLWTPPYWGFYGGRYRWHPGYWGLHVGFYGGVNYGFGYIGVGYFGGYWQGNSFFYNRAVTNVGAGVTNVYVHTVVFNGHEYGPHPTSYVSYNGGRGGIQVAPRPAELAAMHEQHLGPIAAQARLHASAAANPQASFGANHGHPLVAAQERPLGATRTISPNEASFRNRGDFQQQMHPTMQPRPGQQPGQQARPQSPQPQSRPAPRPSAQPHPAPAQPPRAAAHPSEKK